MEVTIPVGSIVRILCGEEDETHLTLVSYDDRSCSVNVRELERCGNRVEGART
jgi:hypothetical protein